MKVNPPEKVGLLFRSGHPFRHAWSGIPSGLARGLSELGLEPLPIDAEPGRFINRSLRSWAAVVRGNRHGGMLAPEIRRVRELNARGRARRAELDYVIQMGSDFGIPLPLTPFVTYEDMTVIARTRMDTSGFADLLGRRAIDRWVNAQRTCYGEARACCVMSQAAANSIVTDYGVDPSRVHVVWAGRNCEPRPVQKDWTHPRFLFVGHDWIRKNGPLVVRTFVSVRRHFQRARLDIVGGHDRIDVDGVVTHGPLSFDNSEDRTRLEALFESATCFVMPSQFEPFGIVYVEAAAAGVPSIGTCIGGAADAIGEEGGVLLDPSDEGALFEAMEMMCDPTRAAEMGAAALRRSRLFTWRAVATRIVDVLHGTRRTANDP